MALMPAVKMVVHQRLWLDLNLNMCRDTLMWLELSGMDVEHLQFKRCDKSFKFGGDGESVSRWDGPTACKTWLTRFVAIQCFVIFGATPMLVGRPILEMLNAVVDFGGM